MIRKCFTIILLSFMFIANTFAVEITSWKSTYKLGDEVWIEAKDLPNNVNDWIGIYSIGENSQWKNVVSWVWAHDTSVTSVDPGSWYKFEDKDSEYYQGKGPYLRYSKQLPIGTYEARLFLRNGFHQVAKSAPFSVVADHGTQLELNQRYYESTDSITVSYTGMYGGDQDWFGVYRTQDDSTWSNVMAWSWSDGRVDGVVSINFQNLPAGDYEVRAFFKNSFQSEAAASFQILASGSVVGARPVTPTPMNKGTLFAAPNGNGEMCTKSIPCSIEKAVSKLSAGEVLFLRGGTYPLPGGIVIPRSGTNAKPIIIESYPGEQATLDGLMDSPAAIIATRNARAVPGVWVQDGIDYIHIRKIEVKNMRNAGIKLDSKHNIVEGCKVHNNYYNGIHITNGNNLYAAPYKNGFNIIRDNLVHENSDVGLFPSNFANWPYNNGNNSDGISISSSRNNTVIYNTVYANSDDGIDTWRSNYSLIANNFSYDNGRGDGNGDGIKAGSGVDNISGLGAIVERNISYRNKARGFNYNGGTNVTFRYNTSYDNRATGFKTDDNTIVERNISSSPNGNPLISVRAMHDSNSWQENSLVRFKSINPDSVHFLHPVDGSVFTSMGVFAD